MVIKTRYFGEVEIDEGKIINFERGLIGFENLKRFAFIYDNTDGEDKAISWLQSVDEPMIALPIIDPDTVYTGYNPIIEDEYLVPLNLTPDATRVFVTLTVPSDITKITANLKAPIIVNAATMAGLQIIAENDLPVKYNIYDAVQKLKEEKGE